MKKAIKFVAVPSTLKEQFTEACKTCSKKQKKVERELSKACKEFSRVQKKLLDLSEEYGVPFCVEMIDFGYYVPKSFKKKYEGLTKDVVVEACKQAFDLPVMKDDLEDGLYYPGEVRNESIIS